MASKKFDFVKITTPASVAIFPYLTTPDTGKYAPPGGQFKVTLRFPKSDPFVSRLEQEAERCFGVIQEELRAAGKVKLLKALKRGTPFKVETDDDGNETGDVLVTLKRKVLSTNKRTGETKSAVIPVFDGAGNKLPSTVEVWGGSVVRASLFVTPYLVEGQQLAGASLKLSAVQVIELVTRGGGSASDFGFDTDGDAIEVSAAPAAKAEAGEADADVEPTGDGADF